MAHAQYFAETDSYWQNSTSFFVGPFASRAEAEQWIEAITGAANNVWRSDRFCGGNIKDATRVYVHPLTKTEARRRGLSSETQVAANTAPTEDALTEEIRWLREQPVY